MHTNVFFIISLLSRYVSYSTLYNFIIFLLWRYNSNVRKYKCVHLLCYSVDKQINLFLLHKRLVIGTLNEIVVAKHEHNKMYCIYTRIVHICIFYTKLFG